MFRPSVSGRKMSLLQAGARRRRSVLVGTTHACHCRAVSLLAIAAAIPLPANAAAKHAPAPFAIQDERLNGSGAPPCVTNVELTAVEHGYIAKGMVERKDGKDLLFCPGAKHRWKGVSIDIEGAIRRIESDEQDPLTFKVDKQLGYVYQGGKGTMELADGTKLTFPPPPSSERNKAAARTDSRTSTEPIESLAAFQANVLEIGDATSSQHTNELMTGVIVEIRTGQAGATLLLNPDAAVVKPRAGKDVRLRMAFLVDPDPKRLRGVSTGPTQLIGTSIKIGEHIHDAYSTMLRMAMDFATPEGGMQLEIAPDTTIKIGLLFPRTKDVKSVVLSGKVLPVGTLSPDAAGSSQAPPPREPSKAASPPSQTVSVPKLLITDPSFRDTTVPSGYASDVSLQDGDGDSFSVGVPPDKKEYHVGVYENRLTIWSVGSRHTWIGRVRAFGYVFDSSTEDPLVFVVTAKGYKYQKGRGIVERPDGVRLALGGAKNVPSAGSVDAQSLSAPAATALPSTRAAPVSECPSACQPGFVCLSGTCVESRYSSCPAGQTCSSDAPGVPATAYTTQGEPYPPPEAPEPVAPLPPMEMLPSAPSTGVHTHDGLFLRTQLGVSETFLSPTPGTRLSGFGSAIDASIGLALSPSLVLGGAFTHSAGTLTATTGTDPPGLRSILFGFGPAAVYYLPLNFSIGTSLGFSRMQFTNDTSKTTWNTALGFFAKAEAGKEWWISDNWSLGASLRYYYMRAKEANAGPYPPVWSAHSVCFLASATFN